MRSGEGCVGANAAVPAALRRQCVAAPTRAETHAILPSPVRPVRIRVEHREAGTATDYEFHSSPVRIGRNPLNDLSLPYSFVSGWHAVIRFDESTARFFDLGSTNGTLCDGRRISAGESALIDAPIRLQIGDLDLVLSREAGRRPSATLTDPPAAPRGRTEIATPAAAPTSGASAGGRRRYMQASGTQPVKAGAIDTDDPASLHTPRPDQTSHMPVSLVHGLLASLRPAFDDAKAAQGRYERELRARIGQLPAHLREQAEAFVRREFGEVRSGAAAGGGTPGADAALGRFCAQLVPELPAPTMADEAEGLLARVRDVLEACAKGIVELQNGQEQFGNEMGVRAVKEFTPLHTASSANNVLEYLLDWRHGGPQRVQELVGMFADMMIHQVALIGGVVEGARAVLGQLAPEEIERKAPGGFGKKAAWQAYVARHREIAGDDRALLQLLFGPEFARAYAEVGGEQARGLDAP